MIEGILACDPVPGMDSGEYEYQIEDIYIVLRGSLIRGRTLESRRNTKPFCGNELISSLKWFTRNRRTEL